MTALFETVLRISAEAAVLSLLALGARFVVGRRPGKGSVRTGPKHVPQHGRRTGRLRSLATERVRRGGAAPGGGDACVFWRADFKRAA